MTDATRVSASFRVTARGLALALLVALVGFTIVAEIVGSATDDPSTNTNSRGSSLGTGARDARAYAELLQRYGADVRRARGDLATTRLDPEATALLIDPTVINDGDAAVLRDFVFEGGHLVIGAGNVTLDGLTSDPPVWSGLRHETWTVDTPGEFNGAESLFTASEGYWISPGTSNVRVGTADASLLVHEQIGAGSIDYLADATLLNNQLIALEDNAAFAVALADNATRPVVFLEGIHDSTLPTGWAAIPDNWKSATWILLIAAALYAWSRGQRFGPPDEQARELAPARGEYIDAVGRALERTSDIEAARAALSEHDITATDGQSVYERDRS